MTGPILTVAARDALVDAALRGVPQAFGRYRDGDARCAVGVLGDAIRNASGARLRHAILLPVAIPYDSSFICPDCGLYLPALTLVQHLNDQHRWDFLAIARKLG